jgi:hypothetical protein
MESQVLAEGPVWLSPGVRPARIVMRAILKSNGEVREYATHIELLDTLSSEHKEYVWGHYFPATPAGQRAAKEDFETRVRERH